MRSQATLLEALQTGIAAQLAPLDDPGLTGTGKSAADMLGVSAAVLAEKLTSHVLREITVRGARGGPLAPLAAQLNYDMTHLQAQQLEGMLGRLADSSWAMELVVESVGRQTKVAGHAFISLTPRGLKIGSVGCNASFRRLRSPCGEVTCSCGQARTGG